MQLTPAVRRAQRLPVMGPTEPSVKSVASLNIERETLNLRHRRLLIYDSAPLQQPSARGGLFFSYNLSLLAHGHAPPRRRRQNPIPQLHMPVGSPVARHVEREFQPGPDSQFVEGGAQVVLDHLFAGDQYTGDVFVGKTLPNQGRDLNLLGG